MTTVLILYASKHGSTAEIAERIAERLRAAGVEVDATSAEEPRDPGDYSAVVVGSAVYAGRWMAPAVNYLRTHLEALSQRPVWLFSSGPTGEGDPVSLMHGWTYPESEKDVVERIDPRGIGLFSGELDAGELNLAEKLIVKVVKAPEGDFRDWAAIDAWADGIAASLAPGGTAR